MHTTTDKPLVNRVAASGLTTLDLEQFYPQGDICGFDLSKFLFRELLLREKDFREAMLAHDWEQYAGKHVAVYCATDAIIPMWAYMLVASYLAPVAADVIQCAPDRYAELYFLKRLSAVNPADYADSRVVVKGCSDKPVPALAYLEITRLLRPHARSILFGEPCSTVPVYKRPVTLTRE